MMTSEKVVSVSAIVIATASIFITFWQGIEMRNHNRLSVRPNLEMIFSVDSKKFGYELENKGLGPAIIRDKVYYLDGKEAVESGFSGLDSILYTLDFLDRRLEHSGLGKGRTIRAEEKLKLLIFYFLEKDDKETLIQDFYTRLGIKINYESMYGEKFTCWFPKELEAMIKGEH